MITTILICFDVILIGLIAWVIIDINRNFCKSRNLNRKYIFKMWGREY